MAARILYVDDDPVMGSLVCAALFDAGHAIGWLQDAQQALAVMRRRPPHLAILDCAMPGLSGVDLLRRMRSEGSLCRVPVIMLTARHSNTDEALAIGAGADDYLRKPVDLDLLVGRIEAVLASEWRRTVV
nr:response regulator [uncultured Sphingomonas sp.]